MIIHLLYDLLSIYFVNSDHSKYVNPMSMIVMDLLGTCNHQSTLAKQIQLNLL
jgi:hypothetical protein